MHYSNRKIEKLIMHYSNRKIEKLLLKYSQRNKLEYLEMIKNHNYVI